MEYVDIDPDSIGNENDTENTLIECIDSTRCECDDDGNDMAYPSAPGPKPR